MLQSKTLAIIVLVCAVALGGGIMTFAIGIPDSPCTGVAGTNRNFTIIANVSGYNDSVDHQGQSWPMMSVSHCDMVTIKIINTDTQTHGFAIDYYAVKGTEIVGGQSISFQFSATRAGRFAVYCTVICTVHYAMLHGLLNVS
jgi:heme/copper-type cytochrome/quinol oxidase subunit 2